MRDSFIYKDDRNGRRWKVRLPKFDFREELDIAQAVAQQLADGKIVGFFYGASEFGPRALGHRSILTDPRSNRMKEILNDKVKHRQWFRPFAPAILEEHCSEYFDLDVPSPHMLLVADVRPDKKDVIPAVLHVDDTARVQTVSKNDGRFREIIEKFYALTGVPLVLNTSFNDHGEPIVETPQDAFACFAQTHMDVLVLGKYLITKRGDNG